MGLSYVGDCEFAESTEFQLSRDLYGLDTLQRSWDGRADKLKAFLPLWPIGKKDPSFKTLKIRSQPSITTFGNGAFVRVSMEFVGLIMGVLPPVVESGGYRRQTVTLYQDGTGTAIEITYRAPVITYKYVTRERPKNPRFARPAIDPIGWQILERVGSQTGTLHEVPNFGIMGGHQLYGTVELGAFNYARNYATSVFDFESVGDYWTVTEQTEGTIQQLTGDDAPRSLPSTRLTH